MRWLAVTGVVLLACAGPARAQTAETCAPEAQIMMLQDIETFDLSPRGWRRVLQQDGCDGAAADLVAKFAAFQASSLQPEEIRSLRWHEGQLRARAGDLPRALRLLTGARDGADIADPKTAYMGATLAFLKSDRSALEAARGRLAAVPKPDGFDAAAAQYAQETGREAPKWPPNLGAVNALIACFGRSYRDATTDPACRS